MSTEKQNLFAYIKGWGDGAGCIGINYSSFWDDEERSVYDQGYIDGQAERRKVTKEYAEKHGVTLNIIKAQNFQTPSHGTEY